jgi:RNase P/RNase MRP subunit p30
MNIRLSSIPQAFLHIRTPTRMENVIQLMVSKIIEAYKSATPSPATATVTIFAAKRNVSESKNDRKSEDEGKAAG